MQGLSKGTMGRKVREASVIHHGSQTVVHMYLFVCVGRYRHATECEEVRESVLSFHHRDPKDQTQIVPPPTDPCPSIQPLGAEEGSLRSSSVQKPPESMACSQLNFRWRRRGCSLPPAKKVKRSCSVTP